MENRFLLRPLCWILGHKWMDLRRVRLANDYMYHLNPKIAMDCDCIRCGYQWRDYDNFNRYPWLDGQDATPRVGIPPSMFK